MQPRFVAIAVMALTIVATGPVSAGSGWSDPIQATRGLPAFAPYARGTAVSQGVIHLVTSDGSGLGLRIRYRRSTDGGRTWSDPVGIVDVSAKRPFLLGDPAIAAFGNVVTVAYRIHSERRAELWTRTSRDGGLTWGRKSLVAHEETTRRIGEQGVAVSSAGIFVSWTDRTDGRIFLAASRDHGKSFDPRVRLGHTTYRYIASDPFYTDGLASLAASGRDVYLLWSTKADPSGDEVGDIVIRASTDGGRTFGAQHAVDRSPSSYGWPAVSAAGSVVVASYNSDSDLVVARSDDHGQTFTRSTLAKSDPSDPTRLAFYVADAELRDDGSAAVLYLGSGQFGGDPATRMRVLIRQSADLGAHWSSPSVVAGPGPRLVGGALLALGGPSTVVLITTCNQDYSACEVLATHHG